MWRRQLRRRLDCAHKYLKLTARRSLNCLSSPPTGEVLSRASALIELVPAGLELISSPWAEFRVFPLNQNFFFGSKGRCYKAGNNSKGFLVKNDFEHLFSRCNVSKILFTTIFSVKSRFFDKFRKFDANAAAMWLELTCTQKMFKTQKTLARFGLFRAKRSRGASIRLTWSCEQDWLETPVSASRNTQASLVERFFAVLRIFSQFYL